MCCSKRRRKSSRRLARIFSLPVFLFDRLLRDLVGALGDVDAEIALGLVGQRDPHHHGSPAAQHREQHEQREQRVRRERLVVPHHPGGAVRGDALGGGEDLHELRVRAVQEARLDRERARPARDVGVVLRARDQARDEHRRPCRARCSRLAIASAESESGRSNANSWSIRLASADRSAPVSGGAREARRDRGADRALESARVGLARSREAPEPGAPVVRLAHADQRGGVAARLRHARREARDHARRSRRWPAARSDVGGGGRRRRRRAATRARVAPRRPPRRPTASSTPASCSRSDASSGSIAIARVRVARAPSRSPLACWLCASSRSARTSAVLPPVASTSIASALAPVRRSARASIRLLCGSRR